MRGVLLERYTGRPIVDPELRQKLRARDLEHVAEFIEQSRLMPAVVGAERNPPLFMDVNNAYSGDELGLPYRDILSEGIVAAGDLAVSAGTGNSVNIAAGAAWVLGDTNVALQPNYRVYNDAVVNLGISPDPTNPRRVLVGAAITDQGFAGSGRTWALQAIHGTPAASPALPATPASFLPLANVLVPAAAASSAAYTFTDLRHRARIGGNVGQAVISTMAAGPPANPADGDIWIATAVDSVGTRWMFQYNAGSASAFKWEFIGGPDVYNVVAAFESTASGTPTNLTTVGPSIVLARSGDYIARYGTVSNITTTSEKALASVFSAAGVRVAGGEADSGVTAFNSVMAEDRCTGLVAGTTYQLKYWASGGATGTWADRWLSFTPVRIS